MSSPPDSFSGDWITPDHPDYTASIARWAANTERRALAVAFVKNAPDVALVLAHAKAHRLPFAIRGGGHSAGGASSCEGGLVIDLSRHLGGCTVDPEKRLAYVGGGALWEAVDRAAIVHGLATVAGTINHVRVCASGSELIAVLKARCSLRGRRGWGACFWVVDMGGSRANTVSFSTTSSRYATVPIYQSLAC